MDTFRVIKVKACDTAEASKQLEKFIAAEELAKGDEGELTNTSRARIADDTLSQLQITCASLQDAIARGTVGS